MIPTFPTFKLLSLSDREDIDTITTKFIPYSDYNFVSMWSYNIEADFQIAKLNDNIIVCFRDYITNEKILSFFGNTQINELCTTLLDYTKKSGLLQELKLIPDFAIADSLNKEIFNTQEDPDNADYIYSAQDWASLPGGPFGKKRHKLGQFKRKYPHYHIEFLDLNNEAIKKDMLLLFDTWSVKKTIDTEHEKIAVTRLLQDAHYFNLLSLGIFVEKKLIGFTIFELVQKNYAILHYTKADHSYTGIFELIYNTFAQAILKKGYRFINREQDLGLVNLRSAKQSWNPTTFLKKYSISYK